MKLYISTLPQEPENNEETGQTQQEPDFQAKGELSKCPFCKASVYWLDGVPFEPSGSVHLARCNMGRF